MVSTEEQVALGKTQLYALRTKDTPLMAKMFRFWTGRKDGLKKKMPVQSIHEPISRRTRPVYNVLFS